MFNLHHYDNLGTARFVTFNCYRQLPFLGEGTSCMTFLTVLNEMRNKERFKLLGYVLMPDHVHLVLLPDEPTPVGPMVGRLKGLVSRKLLPGLREAALTAEIPSDKLAFWNRRCYDHNCRTPEKVREKIEYCHNNPVRRGLVSEPGQWKWSSYNWYVGKRDVPIVVDDFSQ